MIYSSVYLPHIFVPDKPEGKHFAKASERCAECGQVQDHAAHLRGTT